MMLGCMPGFGCGQLGALQPTWWKNQTVVTSAPITYGATATYLPPTSTTTPPVVNPPCQVVNGQTLCIGPSSTTPPVVVTTTPDGQVVVVDSPLAKPWYKTGAGILGIVAAGGIALHFVLKGRHHK